MRASLAVLLLLLAASVGLAAGAGLPAEVLTAPAAGRQPHLVFLLADDYGWANIGYHRAEPTREVQTPALDGLARAGVELDRHYAFKFCSPTRSSLQSGRLPVHVNVLNLSPEYHNPADPVGGFSAVPRNVTGLATKLRAAGYATHQIGKWDAGMATPDHTPQGRGYDTSLGYFHHANDYWTEQAEGYVDLWRTDAPARDLNGTRYEEALFADEALRVLRQHDPATPLFLFYAFHIVHAPLQVPQPYLDRFAFINDTDRRTYAAMVNYMDDVVGNVTQLLREKGMWNDTLVVFSADNGGPVYKNGGANNFPLRGGKMSNFEGGVRVNAFASGGLIPPHRAGAKESGYVHICDWYTTFCSLAGVDPTDHRAALAGLPPVDGLDMWPLLSGQTPVSPRTEIHLDTTALISGSYKVLTGPVPQDFWQGPFYPNETNPDGGYPNTLHCADRGCLFNILDDPTEHNELGAHQPAVLAEMLRRLALANTSFYNPDRGQADPAATQQAIKNGGFWGPWLP